MLVGLLAVTNVSAADNLTDEFVDETDSSDLSAVDNLDNELINSEDTSEINTGNSDNKTTSLINDDSADSSENYQYSVSLNNYTVDGGYNSESITMYIYPTNSNGSDYNYDFYLNIYDSKNVKKVSKRYHGVGSASSSFSTVTYQLGTSDFHPEQGVFTMKIVNKNDNFEMTSAKLTIKTIPYSAYSVNVQDIDMMYWTSGTIPINVHVLTADYYSYRFQYDFYLNIYDSNNNVRFSKNYYGKSSAASTTINHDFFADTIGYGLFTVKIINTMDNHLMATAKLNIVKISIESEDLSVTCEDIIQYKVRVSKNNQYESGLTVLFICNNIEYTRVTDSNGYATLKIHLKAGIYTVTAKYENIIKSNKIYVNPVYVGNKCRNVYISAVNEYYNQNMKINYGWEGNLDGYFKIFKGNSLIYNKRINTGSNVSDYFEYSKHDYNYANNQLSVGSYTVKLVADDGTILKTSSFKIIKTPTELSIGSKKAKSGKKITISSYVLDDIMGGCAKKANGKVTLKVNGKSYSANVKNGKFSISFKSPTKTKKYSCKLTYSGNSNYKGSSTKFTLTVKKTTSIKKKKPKSFTVTVPVKFDKYSSKKVGKYTFRTIKYVKYNDNGRDYGVTTTLLKNKKPMLKSKYKATYWWHFKSGTWKNLSKTRTVTYYDVKNVDKIKAKITIK